MTYSLQSSARLITSEERVRLVRFCARLVGDSEAAEDLTQETLLEAWRHLEGLRDTHKRLPWLFGIARNVCLRWGRQRGRDQARYVPLATVLEPEQVPPEEMLADPFDVEVELERQELVALLDRALAALPAQTRATLVR
ncbi:hypothetical protein KDH_09170 [Dictyobacter sp. S3.2.2.5]|uniref:RNA polymerase sigma factor n=1 Tax=Dictyobacter halimunensis TaxID=3026934 RepID=A0ABQ6FIT0_9CHLR|nr:hypothetical protein KDH_09170 [Dictyobacter sp. S3.2.2.5]